MRGSKITPEEYLELERKAEFKSEYFQGEIFAMMGASRRHILIVTNLLRELSQILKGKPCEVYGTDMRLSVLRGGFYTYPDVTVACEPKFLDGHFDTLLNPLKQPENTWLLTDFRELRQTVHLSSLACDLPLAEIYRQVDWAA